MTLTEIGKVLDCSQHDVRVILRKLKRQEPELYERMERSRLLKEYRKDTQYLKVRQYLSRIGKNGPEWASLAKEMRAAGSTFTAIAHKVGVTRQRVQHVLSKADGS